MTADHETTVAVGGHRRIPVPDPVAHDYLLLGLRLEQHVPGLVDGFYGPAELKARTDIEELRAPSRLVEDADRLLERIAAEVREPDRRDWLTAQVDALRVHADGLAGRRLPYLEHVERCFAWAPVRRDEANDRPISARPSLIGHSGVLISRIDASRWPWASTRSASFQACSR